MKRNWSKVRSGVTIGLSVALMAGLGVGNYYAIKYEPIITTYLGQTNYKVVETQNGDEDTQYFKSAYANEAERLAADAAAGREAASEGFVLLKNEAKTLPMAGNEKVTLFGVSSASILYGGGGSGAVDTSTVPSLRTALEAAGFQVNPTMWDFYTVGAAKDIRMDVADIAGTGRYVIHEAAPELLDKQQVESFASYRDAAIVTLSRSGSESSDIPVTYDESYLETMDIDGYVGHFHSEPLDSAQDVGRSYLELTYTEEKLLEYVSSQFDKVIVLINAGNAMDLSFLDQQQYGVDACLWIGNPGQDGLYALGDILNGTVNPSGRTVDTYAYDPTGAPAVANFGLNTMSGAEDQLFSPFVVYQEGIYVGYKYYETRYEDAVLAQGNAASTVGATAAGAISWNYSDEVQFPFGYGLSYTTFTQTLKSTKEADGNYIFEVEVTNTGDVEGKDVVQVYAQCPYTEYDVENHVEKSAVQLAGYGKTSLLAPGASETLTVTVSKEELKSYDAYGKGTYILEDGDYYFAIAADAHEAVNSILLAKGAAIEDTDAADTAAAADKAAKYSIKESDEFAKSAYTGYEISNRFSDCDVQTYDDSFVYLSRSDWSGTFPQHYQLAATEEMIAALAIAEGTDDPEAEMPTTGAKNGLTLAMMVDVEPEDEAWETLMDQLTAEEMYNLVRVGGYQTQAVNSVSAPSTVDVDGPAYVGNAGTTGVTTAEKTYAWASEVVLSSTWNNDILRNMGTMIGEDCIAQGDLNFAGWYAPAMNTHRTAFSGRNFEYYSEDGFLSGQCGAAVCEGARSKGVITYAKHFALNDQETKRSTINTFSNEQAIREIYLKAFETCIADNGEDKNTLGIMAAMNRIGLTWVGDHYGLMTEVVRNEWGYDGLIITDQASYPMAFPALAIRGGLENGIDMWLNSGTDNWLIEGYETNATVMTQLRNASKHILYAVSQSLAMNGISTTAKVQSCLATWQVALYALDGVVGVLAILLIALSILKMRK